MVLLQQNPTTRTAATTVEMLVAISLLVFAVTAMGRFVVQVNHGLRDRELSARIDLELMNARERIGSWPIERITSSEIGQLRVSEPLANGLADARFVAAVAEIDQPVRATQVTLALQCTLNSQLAQPAVLTFWVTRNSGDGS
jgi:hypothetical protein